MNYRNAQYNQYGTIDCEYEHPEYGWIPFTASADDDIQLGRDLFAIITQDGNAAPYSPVTDADIELDRAAALREADAVAAEERGRVIITGSGQELIYFKKDTQARAFKAAGYPEASLGDYPYVFGHAESLNVTGQEAADAIIEQSDIWEQIGIDIENERIKVKKQIRDAQSTAVFRPILDNYKNVIGGMVDALFA